MVFFFDSLLYSFDIFGYSSFILYNNKTKYKTRLTGFLCLLLFLYILYNLYKQLTLFLLNPKITRFSYIKNPSINKEEFTHLNLSQLPIFLEFYAFDEKFKFYNDIDRILVHKVSFKKDKSKNIEIRKCSEYNFEMYDVKFDEFRTKLQIGENTYCLFSDDNKYNLDYDELITISSNFCQKNLNNLCYDESILKKLKISMTATVFDSKVLEYSKNPEVIVPKTFTFEENSDGKISKEFAISSYYILSNEGYLSLSPIYYNLPKILISDKKFGNSKLEISIRRSRDCDLIERSYETLFDVIAKVGGLLTFMKYLGIGIHMIYQKLFLMEVFDSYVYGNKNLIKDNTIKILPEKIICTENKEINSSDKNVKKKFLKVDWKNLVCFMCTKNSRKRNENIKNVYNFISEILSVKYLFYSILCNYENIKHILEDEKNDTKSNNERDLKRKSIEGKKGNESNNSEQLLNSFLDKRR